MSPNPGFSRGMLLCVLMVILQLVILTQLQAQKPEHVHAGLLRIKVSENMARQLERSSIKKNADNVVATGIEKFDGISRKFKVASMKRLFPHAGKFEAKHRKYGLHRWYEVEIEKSTPIHQAIPGFKSLAELEVVEPVYKKQFVGASNPGFGPIAITPFDGGTLSNGTNDPMLASQWHYNNTGQTGGTPGSDISLFEAWNRETGSPNVIVAIEDGGIDLSHPDLAANLWVNADEIPNNGIDDDGNGYVDDYHGYSFVDHTGNILAHDHGTHVAGTVAAVNNNGLGVAGVAGGSGNGDGVRLMSCAVFSYWGGADGFAQAFIYSADNGAVISQNSWTYTSPGYVEQAVLDGIDYFTAEAGRDEFGNQIGPMNGGIVIFAAANFSSNADYYPAFYEPVLSVASTNHMDAKSWYSNYGSWVDIAAPGGETNVYEQGVLSTLPSEQYGFYQGTSMACPHVSGVAGLVLSQMGGIGFTPALLRERLVQTTDNIDAANPFYIGQLGSGRLNAANALVDEDDGLPPSGITDLAAVSADLHSITLSWTAPADGNRAASLYDLRVSDQPITEENFSSAQPVSGLPVPKMPGVNESLVVNGLNAGALYYFAIKSGDYHGNISAISNIAEAGTLPPPVIEVAPAQLSADLVTAASDTLVFTVSNTGQSTLHYSISDNDSLDRVRPGVQAGSMEPSYSANVEVFVNASGLLAGQYTYNLSILSNDPFTPSVIVPVTLNVTNNGLPIVSLSTSSLNFGKVMLSRSKTLGILVRNEGSEPLELQPAILDHPFFDTDLDEPASISAFESRVINVTFAPTASDSVVSTLTINTNDPQNAELTIQLAAQGVEPPSLVVDPAQFEIAAYKNHVKQVFLNINNSGGSDLLWRLREEPPVGSANYSLTDQQLSAGSGASKDKDVLQVTADGEIDPSGLSQKRIRVLVITPDPDVFDAFSYIAAYPDLEFSITDSEYITPWALTNYDVVILTNNFPWNEGAGDPEMIGNILADYIDIGGKVIIHQMAYSSAPDYQLKGRFMTENYGPLTPASSSTFGFVNLGEILEPTHPILDSVSFLQYNGYVGNVSLTPGSTELARWDNGAIFLAANDDVIAFNLLPSSGTGGGLSWNGDLPRLWLNAIRYLAPTAPTYLAFDFNGGVLEPGMSASVRLRLDASGLAPGSYETKLKLYTTDPNNAIVEIPVFMTIYGEQFTSSPDSIVTTLHRGENHSEVVSITHNGTQSHYYEVTVESYGVQSLSALAKRQGFDTKKNQAPAINPETFREFATKIAAGKDNNINSVDIRKAALPPLPAVLNTVYATDFEDFALGDLNQNGWFTYNGWTVDSTNSFSGEQHLHQTVHQGIDFSLAVSPFVSNGPSAFSSVSLRLNLQGTGAELQIAPLSSNGENQATSLAFATWGIIVYERVGEFWQPHVLDVALPSGYFDLTIETNEVNGKFSVFFDDEEVFHGNGFKGNIAALMMLTFAQSGANLSIDVDDVRLHEGKKFDQLPSFIDVSPISGTISPQETLNLDVLLKTDSIPAGTYVADINFFADQDAITVPVIMNFVGSQLTLTPPAIELSLLADQTTTANFTITNEGQGDVPVTITAVSTGVFSSAALTAPAQAEELKRHYEALRTISPSGTSRVFPELARDSSLITPTAKLYETGFEEFSAGSLQQFNWTANSNGYADFVNPAQGSMHAHLVSQPGGWADALSPSIAPGDGSKSTIAFDIDVSGPSSYANISLHSLSRLVTDVAFSNENEIYVLNYLGNDTYQTVRVFEEIPSGYFTLAVEVDKATEQFSLLIDGRVVYTGQGGDSYVSVAYFGLSGEAGAVVDFDNFRIFDGEASEFPDYLSLSPDSGVVPSGGSLDIAVNVTAPSAAGQYHANIIVQDGPDQKLLPLTLTVINPQLNVWPEYLYQELTVGQTNTQYLYLENIGNSVFDYQVAVNPNGINAALAQMAKNKKQPGTITTMPATQRPFKEVAAQLRTNPNVKIDGSVFSLGKIESMSDSTATLYATSFEEFEFGDANQFGWVSGGLPPVVSDSLPFTGQKHLSFQLVQDGISYQNIISPYVASGNSDFVSASTKINLQRTDLMFSAVAHNPYSGSLAVMLYYYNGSVYIYSNEGFNYTSIQLPEGYFDLTFQVNRQSSRLGVYINQELVYSGYALSNNIGMMEYVVSNDFNINGFVHIDDVRIIDGPVFPTPYLTVSPTSGTLYPYSSTYLYATFDSNSLSKGTYLADIEIKVGGSTVRTVPTTLNVVGLPEIQVTPGTHHTVVDYQGSDTRDLVISNPGGQTLYFNLSIEEQEGIAGAISPVAKTSRDDARTLQKLDEDRKLSNPPTSMASPISVVVGKTVSGEQFESGIPPSGWTVVNNTATGPQWNTAASFGEGNYSSYGEAATVSSDAFGSAPLNTELISPVYDVRGYRDITLQYYANYQNYGNRDFLDLDIRLNGQGEWKTVLKWNEDHGGFRSWGEFVSVNLDYALMGATSFQLRWHYYDSNPGAHDWYAQIDNVSIIAQSLPWLTLNQSWGWVDPGSELNVGMFLDASLLPEGIFSKLVRVYSNAVNAPIVDVPVSMAIRSAANLVFEPDTISERLYLNSSSQRQATMSNTGESVLSYSFTGSHAPAVAKNDVSKIYPANYVVDKFAKDTRVGHPVLTGQGGPDDGGYSWVDSNAPGGPVFNWQDIRYTGNYLSLGDDDNALVDLPFVFPFYGNIYTQLRIGSNGYVTFGPDGSSLGNTELPNSGEPNNLIAAFWDDLLPSAGGSVTYQSFEDRFIVQYTNVPYYYATGSPNTFQIILNRDGDIVLQYLNMNNLFSATTGTENSNGSTGLQIAFNTNFISNYHAILISNKGSRWLNVSPPAGTIDGNSSANITIDFVTEGLATGNYQANLVISSNDGDAPLKYVPVNLTVFDNYEPVIGDIADISVVETQTASLTINAHDQDDPQVTVSITNKPAFMTLTSSGNGTATYAVKPLLNNRGTYTLTVEATDSRGLKSYRNIQVIVIPYGVENFSLIDKRNGQVIQNFAGSVTLNKADAAYPYYQIRANTNPATVGSVQFLLNGKSVKGSASAPYLMADGEIKNLKVGNHTLKATAYTQKSNKGQVGASAEAVITIVNQAVAATGASALTISPNPVERDLRVTYSGSVAPETELVIVDGTGYAVYRTRVPRDEMKNLRLDLSALRPGIYYLQIIDAEGQRVTTRVVKQ